ncbi:MAG TPA: S53 family peptidase [Ktedonobacteraceae bacterium]
MHHIRYRRLSLLWLCFLLGLTACSPLSSIPRPKQLPTRVPPISPTVSNAPVPLDLGLPPQALLSIDLGSLTSSTPMHVVISFKLNATVLHQFAANPRIRAGQSIDVPTLANQVGITDQEYQQIQQFFGGPGITLHLHKLHTSMTIDALSGVLATQLHTHFIYHTYQGAMFYFPSPAILLPRSLAQYIQGASGLDSFSKYKSPTSSINLYPLKNQANNATCVNDFDVLTPPQVSQAYGLTSLYKKGWTGKGMTIILPEFAAYSRRDVQFYLNCVGYRGKLSVVNVDNTPPHFADEEADLDIEMVAGLAPDANIVVYQTDSGNDYNRFWQKFQDIFDKISDDYSSHTQPVVVSVSWGDTEGYLTYNMLKSIDSTLQTLTTVEHINVFAASGDCGAYDSRDYPNTLNVGFPGSDPNVIGVGGTFLYIDNQGNRTREIAWDEDPHKHPSCQNQWGSGGGLSSVFARPTWQQGYAGIQNQYSNGYRQIPDVAASAYYDSVYISGQWYYSGGTSAASPIWAAGYALVQQGLVQSTGYYVAGPAVLYTLARQYASTNPFFDIQKGNNLYYPATPGWDFTTGLGTPNMNSIYNGLQFIVGA